MTADLRAEAEAVRGPADLARVLRGLRQREAQRRQSPPLSYRQIAEETGLSLAAVGSYFAGSRIPSDARFYDFLEVLGAEPEEREALDAARRRIMTAAPAAETRSGARIVAPRALPPPATGFTGRATALAALDELVEAGGSTRFAVITGMPGVGKTALALHWAHRVATHFPDGQLYVDLHAHSGGAPLSIMDALGILLAGLGCELDGLTDLAARSARYHAVLQGQSVLVLLDNVAGSDDMRALLPPPPCVAVVTSRDHLPYVDAFRLVVGALSEAEAMALLRHLLGDRVEREPDAARSLAARCGLLPLALRVAAEQASSRPAAALADLVGELGALDAFAVPGDPRADLRSVFSWSVRRLPAAAKRVFCLLGVVPCLDIDRHGLAALAGTGLGEADELIRNLVAAHLVESHGAGRYAMHDLVRAYAAETADQHMSTEECRAAMGRLLRYYIAVTTTAVDLMFAYYRDVRAGADDPTEEDLARPEFCDAEAAAAWLATERVNLVRACGHAARRKGSTAARNERGADRAELNDTARDGWPREAIALALVLGRFLEDLHYDDALSVFSAAAEAIERLGDDCGPAQRAGVSAGLGLAHWRLGRPELALRHIESALEDNQAAGNIVAATRNLAMLGVILEGQGRYRDAIASQRRGLDLARTTGLPRPEAIALLNLASAHLRVEEFQEALDLYEQALRLGGPSTQSWPLGPIREGMAHALIGVGRFEEALAEAQASVAIYRGIAQVLYRLRAEAAVGWALLQLGRPTEAVDHLTAVLAECRDHGTPRPTALVLNRLGDAWHQLGEPEQALACHAEALELSDRHSDRAEHTRALLGLGDAYADAGDSVAARDYWRRAYAEYHAATHPAAERVRARLEALDR